MVPAVVMIAALLVAPGIDFARSFAAGDAPVHIDECSASRDGLDLIYRFDLSNTSTKPVEHVEVTFLFANAGDRTPRGTQRLQITTEMEAGQSLRFSGDTGAIRRADISHHARYGACTVTSVGFADGTRVDIPIDQATFATASGARPPTPAPTS